MWKTVFKWTLLVALAAYAVVMAIWARGEAASHVCRGVDIVLEAGSLIDDSLARASLLGELERFPAKTVGAQASSINTLALERHLSKFNNFEHVKCILAPDNRLKVIAKPMVPEIRVFTPQGRSYYVNAEGKRIDADARFFADVPVVQGSFSKAFRETDVLPVVRFVKSDPELSALIASVKADGPSDILLVPYLKGHVVNFGDTTRLAEKKRALMTVYRSIMPRRGWLTYDTVSVKFRNQAVCTLRHHKERTDYSADPTEPDMEEATLQGIEIEN